MKIAIMTQPLGKNYGGIMQAYALQKVLKDMGHSPITIDYQTKERGFIYKKFRLAYRLAKKATGKRQAPINLESKIGYLTKHNQEFINANIVQSKYINESKKLKKHFKKNSYDAVIVGSDQTWRPKYSPNIYDFYLDFISKDKRIKRIAYASSFGVDDWEYSQEETKKCSKLAKLFDAISVREQSGVDLCKEYLGVDSELVLDPTLLLEKEDYLALIGDRYKADKSEGVFTYFLDKNEDKKKAAEYIANELSSRVYICQAKHSLDDLSSNKLEDYKMPAVQDWLASFANAEFVLTDSFHGMVFSIVFGKPFLVIVNKERGAARFESLLNKIGGLEHLVYEPSVISKGLIAINSLTALEDERLNVIKINSLSYLEESLK
ncbi:polysaccharide pyruvyl transferase family protein [uncultured Psychrobacter sp.]|uniref:polysaccharide pyruvyl transferase family protein n=1 Tax=uncultured Psychrobacter sp. TaxID=259303 RepID=UPI0026349F67|nr:polysaccharide pyruvyl transferase family protein [uncultured Psychrobacter sp.]